MLNKIKLLDLYKLSIFVIGISSMYPWFFLRISSAYFALWGAVLSWWLYKKRPDLFYFDIKLRFPLFFLFVVLFWNGLHASIIGFVEIVFTFIILFFLINTKSEVKSELIQFVTKYFAIGILISLIYYILWLLGIELPNTNGSHPQGYTFVNYYLMTIKDVFEGGIMVPRFQSVFLEPGHLTMGIIPTICMNRFDLRNKYVTILFIAQLFTLSLAGYVCLFALALICIFKTTPIRFLGVTSIILLTVYCGQLSFKSSKYEGNVIYDMIIARAINYGDNGQIMGNRFKDNTLKAYNNLMESSDAFWGFGLSEEGQKAQDGSSGYKVYIVLYGIIGILLLTCFYLSYLYRFQSIWGLQMLLIYILLFLQNSYPFWFVVVFSYILALPYFSREKLKL